MAAIFSKKRLAHPTEHTFRRQGRGGGGGEQRQKGNAPAMDKFFTSARNAEDTISRERVDLDRNV